MLFELPQMIVPAAPKSALNFRLAQISAYTYVKWLINCKKEGNLWEFFLSVKNLLISYYTTINALIEPPPPPVSIVKIRLIQ